MKFPFSKIFKSPTKEIPEVVKKQLENCFPNAKNIEWELKNQIYEAIFYLSDVEHIAQISKKGDLLEYKKNLWPGELPDVIKNAGSSFGEIMNGIIIYRGEEVFYEMIPDLALAMRAVIQLFDPEVLLLGGPIWNLMPDAIDKLKENLPDRIEVIAPGTTFAQGAFASVFHRVIVQSLSIPYHE